MRVNWKKILHMLGKVLPWVVFPCASFYFMETFHHNPFINMNRYVQALNIIIFVAIALLLWMVNMTFILMMGFYLGAVLILQKS